MKKSVIDKSTWGEGPWQKEPDRVEWEHNGLPCLMVRHNSLGHWCGYVAVKPGHPCFEKSYSAPWDEETMESKPWPTDSIEVHGGLTYADHCQGHVCHVPKPGEPDNVWWLGFDMAHCDDLSPGASYQSLWSHVEYRDVAYVKREVESLAEQLFEMADIAKEIK